jgi:hypothetical protein
MKIKVLTLLTSCAQYSMMLEPLLPNAVVTHCTTEAQFKTNLGKKVPNLIVVIDESFINNVLSATLGVTVNRIIILSKYMTRGFVFVQEHLSEYLFQEFEPKQLIQQKLVLPTKIFLPSITGFEIVEFSQIIYVEAENNCSVFVTKEGNFKVSKTLKNYEKHLEAHDFQRISKEHLINLHCVKGYTLKHTALCLKGAKAIPLSNHYKKAFIKALNKIAIIIP